MRDYDDDDDSPSFGKAIINIAGGILYVFETIANAIISIALEILSFLFCLLIVVGGWILSILDNVSLFWLLVIISIIAIIVGLMMPIIIRIRYQSMP